MQQVLDRVFDISTGIRYVALYQRGRLTSAVRPGLQNASAAESDKYEELLVNPTLLMLAGQRGAIDCGGLEFLVVRYGHFFELVWPLSTGHLSIGIEPAHDPLAIAPGVGELAAELDRRAASDDAKRRGAAGAAVESRDHEPRSPFLVSW